MKTMGWILVGYGLMILLAGSHAAQVVSRMTLHYAIAHLPMIQAFLVLLR